MLKRLHPVGGSGVLRQVACPYELGQAIRVVTHMHGLEVAFPQSLGPVSPVVRKNCQ